MKIELFWSPKLATSLPSKFRIFAQGMANRLMAGDARYGAPKASQMYFSRLKEEVKAYNRSGNIEHLRNIANYAFLESMCPEHSKSHDNAAAESATRKKFGGTK